jgi:hypothetical protein
MHMLRIALLVSVLLAASAAPALGMASHEGWPPRDPGMLLMNKTDSDRPLDARPGRDPFGGQDPSYSCDEEHKSSDSCLPRLVGAPVLSDGVELPPGLDPRDLDPSHLIRLGAGLVVTDKKGHNRLLGGHGDDKIHAGPWGDVLWGDYKPTNQTTRQSDRLIGGAGPDFIYPSHGRNVVKAGAGSDSIHGLYGHGTIDCGPGRDALYLPAKPGAYKIRNCEWKQKRFGESAPRWLLDKLPWPITDE